MTTAATWVMRVLWLTLPFTLGEAVSDALDERSRPVQLTASIALWVLWGLVLLAMLIPRAWALTPLRVGTAGGALVGVAISAFDEVTAPALIGSATAVLCAVIATTALIGDRYIDGSSYGTERRTALRPPPLYSFVLAPVSCLFLLLAVSVGPLLLAAGQWVVGAIVTALSVPVAIGAWRALHALSRRWLVFVPAGVVIHDHLTLQEPVLVRRTAARSIGPALADTMATDLTAGASGLALEMRLDPPVAMGLRVEPGGVIETNSVIVTPSLASKTLEVAADRRFPVG